MNDHLYHGFLKIWILNGLGFIFSISELESLVGLVAGILNLFVVGYSLYFLHKKAQREDQEHEKKEHQETEQKTDK
jgi:hypothetical protein